MRILIVEDDELLASGLTRALAIPGYAVDHVSNGEKALLALDAEHYDLLVLDIGLPGIDGFGVLRRVRERRQTLPALILTARDAVSDRVRGLDLGADDYMTKPFALGELEARVRALLRRGHHAQSAQLSCGALLMDTLAHRAWLNHKAINLTAREWGVLEYLLMRQGQVLSKDKIMQAVCNWDEEISSNAVEVYMSRLRTKLDPAGVHIRTVRGYGYLLDEADNARP
jgi:two-component system OmpR family response regulator